MGEDHSNREKELDRILDIHPDKSHVLDLPTFGKVHAPPFLNIGTVMDIERKMSDQPSAAELVDTGFAGRAQVEDVDGTLRDVTREEVIWAMEPLMAPLAATPKRISSIEKMLDARISQTATPTPFWTGTTDAGYGVDPSSIVTVDGVSAKGPTPVAGTAIRLACTAPVEEASFVFVT